MWIELVIAIIGLVTLIVKEALSSFNAAAKEKKAFEIKQESFQKLVTSALSKQLLTMPKETKGAKDAWDAADGKNQK